MQRPNDCTAFIVNYYFFGTDHGNIRLVNLHLSPNANSSRLQTNTLVDELHEQFQVGCGDLNQGATALESSQLSHVVPEVWFNTKVVKAAPDSNRGQIDWVFSTCGKPVNENPRQDDIDSDHFALTQVIDLSLCH